MRYAAAASKIDTRPAHFAEFLRSTSISAVFRLRSNFMFLVGAQPLNKALPAIMADGAYKSITRKWILSEDDALDQPMINGQP